MGESEYNSNRASGFDLHLKAYHDVDYDDYDLDNCPYDGDDKKKPRSHT